MLECWQQALADSDEVVVESEVDRYLLDPIECPPPKEAATWSLLHWWKLNGCKYPNLALVAKDVLAIQVSTVASESSFSTGGRVIDPFRSSLTPKTVEALLCLQNWSLLHWWKLNGCKYPNLALVAKDVLAIQVSMVASESSFSTGGRVIDPFRSSLTPKTVEALLSCKIG
ncbi:hypothetical protein ACLB2K_011950 [Fragaria x ananassa]